MGRITVNGTIAAVQRQAHAFRRICGRCSGGRAKGRSLEADRINRHLDNIRIAARTVITSLSATVTDMLPPRR